MNKDVTIQVGLSKTFYDEAPELVSVLEKVNVPIDLLNSYLAKMATERLEASEAANNFLANHEEIWTQWVSAEAATKIKAAL